MCVLACVYATLHKRICSIQYVNEWLTPFKTIALVIRRKKIYLLPRLKVYE